MIVEYMIKSICIYVEEKQEKLLVWFLLLSEKPTKVHKHRLMMWFKGFRFQAMAMFFCWECIKDWWLVCFQGLK